MPRPCAVVAHVRSYDKQHDDPFWDPRACPVESHVHGSESLKAPPWKKSEPPRDNPVGSKSLAVHISCKRELPRRKAVASMWILQAPLKRADIRWPTAAVVPDLLNRLRKDPFEHGIAALFVWEPLRLKQLVRPHGVRVCILKLVVTRRITHRQFWIR